MTELGVLLFGAAAALATAACMFAAGWWAHGEWSSMRNVERRLRQRQF